MLEVPGRSAEQLYESLYGKGMRGSSIALLWVTSTPPRYAWLVWRHSHVCLFQCEQQTDGERFVGGRKSDGACPCQDYLRRWRRFADVRKWGECADRQVSRFLECAQRGEGGKAPMKLAHLSSRREKLMSYPYLKLFWKAERTTGKFH